MQNDDNTQSFVQLTAGTRVAHYQIISKIGAGGMGEVYLADDTKLDRRVALKFLSFHLSQDQISRARFTREAKAAAKLDHPNIVPVHEVGEYQSRPFFAMAHIKGQSLRDVIKQGKLTVSGAIDYCMQICEGLNEAHSAGIVHRDIKPGNIIIDTKNKPRILDFGLATLSGEEKLTKTGSTLGTVGYMSPEQITGKDVDQRSDIFSVGVILYEMLTGRRPFEGDNDAAVVKAITDATPEPVSRFKSGVSGELQQVVDKALSKDVSLRYQHADGMLSDLKRLKTEPVPTPPSKIGLWIAAAVVVLAAGYFIVDQFMLNDSAIEDGWTNSIAVLPLRNFSPDKDQEYFSDGMTDAIIGKLSGIKNLKVISMTSVMRYKNPDRDLKKIGHDLQVNTILEGSVLLEGNRLRVRVQLINVADDAHIWSQTYDRELESIFDIQDDISQAVVNAMRIELLDEGSKSISRRYTKDIEAYNSYTRGRQLWITRDYKNLLQSIEHFERAIELDPNYALAYSGLADAWTIATRSVIYAGQVAQAEALKKAREAAETAIEIDESLAEAHASLGYVYHLEASPEKAEPEFRRSIELNPGYFWSHYWYSQLLENMARYQDGIKEEDIAFQIHPMSYVLALAGALRKTASHEWQEAEQLYLRMIEIEPNLSSPYLGYSNLLGKMGKHDEAISQAKLAVLRDVESYNNLAYSYEKIGKFDSALWAANKAIELAPHKHNAFDTRADMFALNGMLDSAIVSFSKALKIESDFPNCILALGHLYLLMQEYGKADSLYRILASHSDKYWRSQGRRALAKLPLHQGKFKLALELLNKYKDETISDSINDWRQVRGIFRRGVIFQEILGMHDSAIAEFEEVIKVLKKIAPNDYYVHNSRGRIGYSYALRGDFERADQFIQEIEANFDRFGPRAYFYFWFHSGRVELEKGNYDSAIANLERVVMINPDHNYRQNLARCYFRAGRIDDAIVLYEKIINRYERYRAVWPAWSVITHFNLGKTYEAAGRNDEAIEQYKTFLDIWRDADDGIKMIEDAKARLAKLRAG